MKKTLIKVGSYQLGFRPVELFIDTSHGAGSGDLIPKKGKLYPLSNLIVGVKNVPLWGAWGTLVHEAFEMSLVDHKASYKTGAVFTPSTEERSFFFDHRVFTRMCDEVGNLLFECKRDFDRAYHKARPKKSSRKKP